MTLPPITPEAFDKHFSSLASDPRYKGQMTEVVAIEFFERLERLFEDAMKLQPSSQK